METMGERLKQLIEKKGISQKELAEKVLHLAARVIYNQFSITFFNY